MNEEGHNPEPLPPVQNELEQEKPPIYTETVDLAAGLSSRTVIVPTPGIVLTEEQDLGVKQIVEWMENYYAFKLSNPTTPPDDEYKLGGYAGTGKTTIIKTIISELGRHYNIVVCAFTGKACHVLQRKGIHAQTLHSLMYHADADPASPGQMIFYKRDHLEGLPDLIIVDEASMVSTELYNDLKSFKIPCLFVGDPGQLEPVGDNPNLMKEPDYVLQKIHRQAEGNPIITLAQSVRLGGSLTPGTDDGKLYIDYKSKNLNTHWLSQADQVICGRNKTKKQLNTNFRIFFKRKETIEPGEKLMVLRNNTNYGVFNGMILIVDKIISSSYDNWLCACHDEVGVSRVLPIWKDGFEDAFDSKNPGRVPRKVVWCDYGYVITCHKSQGSEWKHVHVIDEFMPPHIWSMKRWRYTAITRAAERLVYSI